MKKITTFVTAAALIASTAGLAVAADNKQPEQRSGHSKPYQQPHMGKDGMPRGFEHLNLTEAQKSQIQSIMQKNRPQQNDNARAEQQKQFEAQRAQEQRLIEAKTFDEAAARQMINQRMAERQQKMGELELNRLKTRHAVFQVLTPAQQKQWQEQQAQRTPKRMPDNKR